MEDKKFKENKDLQQQILQLRKWLEQKPYVPKDIDEKLYIRFLHSCYYDLEKTKAAADLFFSMRLSTPELFANRDPLSAHIQKVMKITNLALYRISGNRNLWIFQLNDPGLYQYDHLAECKFITLAGDSWILDDDFLEEEDVYLYDAKDISLKVLTKFNFSVGRKMSKYHQDAKPVRQKQVHIINAPNSIYRIFYILKPFLAKGLMEMIHIHTPNSTTLYNYLSRDELPEEFGGTRGKMSDYVSQTINSIMKNRELLIDNNLWRCEINDKKNNKPIKEKASTEISSLRTLSID